LTTEQGRGLFDNNSTSRQSKRKQSKQRAKSAGSNILGQMHTQDYVFDSSAVDSSDTTTPTAVESPVRAVSVSVRRNSATSDALITDTRYLYDVMSGDEKIILSGSDDVPIQRPKSTSGNKQHNSNLHTSTSATIAQLLLISYVCIA
jgi:hypothetical protein